MASPVPDEAVCPCGSEWFRLVDDGVDDEIFDEFAGDDRVGEFVNMDALELLGAAFATDGGAGVSSEGRPGLVALTGSGAVRAYAGVVVCSECQRPWAPGQRHLRLVN